MMRSTARRTASRNGGALLWVLLAAGTLIVVATVVVIIVMRFQTTQEADHRNALRISEEGIQQALMSAAKSAPWSTGLPRTESSGGWFQVTITVTDTPASPKMTLTSEGHSGSSTIRQVWILQRIINGSDTGWVPLSQKQE